MALNLTRARVLDNTSDITGARTSEFGEIVLDGLSRSTASSISNSTRITRRTCVVTITNSATQGTSSASGRGCPHMKVNITAADAGRGKVYQSC